MKRCLVTKTGGGPGGGAAEAVRGAQAQLHAGGCVGGIGIERAMGFDFPPPKQIVGLCSERDACAHPRPPSPPPPQINPLKPTPQSTNQPTNSKPTPTNNNQQKQKADVRVVLRAEDDAVRCLKRVVHRIIEELDLRPPKAKMWEEKRTKMKNLCVFCTACFLCVCGGGGGLSSGPTYFSLQQHIRSFTTSIQLTTTPPKNIHILQVGADEVQGPADGHQRGAGGRGRGEPGNLRHRRAAGGACAFVFLRLRAVGWLIVEWMVWSGVQIWM